MPIEASLIAQDSHRTQLGSSSTAPCGKSLASLYLCSPFRSRRLTAEDVVLHCWGLSRIPGWGRRRAALGWFSPWQDEIVSSDSNAHKITQGPFSHTVPSTWPEPMMPHRTNPPPQPSPSQCSRCPFKSCRPPLLAPLPSAFIGRPGRRSPPVPVSATLPCWRQSLPLCFLIGPCRQCLWRRLARARSAPHSGGRATPSPAWPLLIGHEGLPRARRLAAAWAAGWAAQMGSGAEAVAGLARGVRSAEDGPGARAAAPCAQTDRECRWRGWGQERPR